MGFEIAAMNATNYMFGNSVLVKRFFLNLYQSTWRNAKQLGICSLYRNNIDFRICFGMINTLPFLPLCEVIDGMVYLYTKTSVQLLVVTTKIF